MSRDHLLQHGLKRTADASDVPPPAPGRQTQLTGAPTTLEGLGLQALRVAQGALGQIIAATGKLGAANNAKHSDPAAVLEMRSALGRMDTALAQMTLVLTQIDSPQLEVHLPILRAQRIGLANVIDPMLATQAQLAQAQPQAPTQAPQAPAQAPPPAAPPKVAAHPGEFVAPTPVKAAEVAPATKTDDSVPNGPGYAPTWQTIHDAATGDAAAMAALDVAWIDALDSFIVGSIDGGFTKANQTAAFAAEVKKNQQLAKLEGQEREDKLAELKQSFDARKQPWPYGAISAVAPPADGVTRDEGRLLARADFMAWGSHVLGSPAAVKAHFQALRKVKNVKGGSLFLWAPAAARLEAAWDWFERTYPGNTFFQTDVGFGLRGVHHQEHPLSYLGHALGFSVDFRAYDNPSYLKDGGVGMFLLSRIGGHQENGKDVPGQVKMKLPDFKKVQEMGRASERGEDVGEEGNKLLEAAGASYDQMAQTSDNFQAAFAPHMTALKTAQQTWFEAQGIQSKLKTAEAKLKTAKAAAGAKVPKKASKEDRDAAIAADDGVKTATKERDDVAAEFEAKRKVVMEAADKVFKPWADKLRAEAKANVAGREAEVALAIDFKAADHLVNQVGWARTKKQLTALLATPTGKIVFDVEKLSAIEDFAELHAAMKARAAAVRTAKYNAQANGVIEKAITRLGDPRAIFGDRGKFDAKTSTWSRALEVNVPSLMQVAEIGFARSDELADGPTPGKSPRQVFNREFIMAMTRFGWTTGASWGEIDTMHFDFLDGFSAVKSKGFFSGGNFGPQP
jgi:hypothetical protein